MLELHRIFYQSMKAGQFYGHSKDILNDILGLEGIRFIYSSSWSFMRWSIYSIVRYEKISRIMAKAMTELN